MNLAREDYVGAREQDMLLIFYHMMTKIGRTLAISFLVGRPVPAEPLGPISSKHE